MQQNPINANSYGNYPAQQEAAPSAVSINIYSPQAYGKNPNPTGVSNNDNYYHLYGPNLQNNLPIYPANYNNMFIPPTQNPMQYPQGQYQQNPIVQYPGQTIQYPNQQLQNQAQSPIDNNLNATGENDVEKTQQPIENNNETNTENNKKDKAKKITPLTDEYVKSLENYLNDPNPKIRLIGAKDLMERFKEDENRKDNKSLIPLLNKMLRDTSAAVRFLGLTTLQLGYSVGNDETVQILKEIQTQNPDKIGEDQLLASEILLKMSAAAPVEVKE